MILDMQQALEAATQRFNETAAAMRATAKEVGSELENTRSELARGVIELPEETKSSAAAMRRVVAEQIEALAELNAIVRSQPATHDLSERRPPAAPTRQSIIRDEAPVSRPEPTRQPEAPRSGTSAPAAVAQAPSPAPAQPATQRYVPMPDVPVASAPRPATPVSAAAARPAEQKAEGGGWLRDVLRNASGPSTPAAAPAAAPPAQQAAPAQGLNTLTEEIAKAMDQAALAEAWQRYQSGEQNVFSRRIYTLTGQATYDEVRKRIQRDQDFAATAATYMAEFEQLLKRAAGGTDPVAETREFLLSDRGRVYTMLAHASGRLG
jgi:flagellar motor protein MotB